MAASRGGQVSSLFRYINQKPLVALIACGAAYTTGYTVAVGSLPFFPRRDKTPVLNTSSFTPYTLVAKHKLTASSSIFVLRPPLPAKSIAASTLPSSPTSTGSPPTSRAATELARLWGDAVGLWSVQVKQPELQIGREYTPLPPTNVLGENQLDPNAADIQLLIRREKGGEMTTYLDSLPISSTISLRGPYQDVQIPAEVDEILFLAGGTGIAPALQAAHVLRMRSAIAGSDKRAPKIHIMWANRKGDECAGAPIDGISAIVQTNREGTWGKWWSFGRNSGEHKVNSSNGRVEEKGLVVQTLEEMKREAPKGQFQVQYFVDEEDSFIRSKEVRRILASNSSNNSVVKLIMVSGPEGFVDYWAGRKRLEEGREQQGPLAGRLGQMDLNGWKVWKV